MAFVAEVKARLGLDTTDFQRGLTKSVADMDAVGTKMGKVLDKGFGARKVFKGILAGIGISSVDKVVDAVARMWSGLTSQAEEYYKNLADLSDKNTEMTIENMRKQASEQVRLDLLVKERARAINNPTEGFTARGPSLYENALKLAADMPLNPFRLVAQASYNNVYGSRQEENRAGENAAREAAKARATAADAAIKEIQKDREERTKKAFEEERKAEEKLTEAQRNSALKSMSADERMVELKKEQRDLSSEIFSEGAGQSTVAQREKLLDVEDRIRETQKEINEERKREAELAKRVAKAQREVQAAVDDENEAFFERSALTLEEVAARNTPGVSSQARGRAREVMRLEAQAKRQRAGGFDTEANISTSRALKLRESLGMLTASDRDPMAKQREQMEKSLEYLEEIRDNLNTQSLE